MFSKLVFAIVLALGAAEQCPNGQAPVGPCKDSKCQDGYECVKPLDQCCPIGNDTLTTVYPSNTGGPRPGPGPINPTVDPSCKDRTNRKTGISECPFRAGLCDIPIYSRIMTVQCPRTCGKCPGQQPLTKTACVDLVNPATNSSECSSRIDLCMDPVYQDVMMKQCRKTCGFCSSTTNKTAVINPAMRGNLKKVFPRRHQKDVQNDNKTYFLKITLQDFIGNVMR